MAKHSYLSTATICFTLLMLLVGISANGEDIKDKNNADQHENDGVAPKNQEIMENVRFTEKQKETGQNLMPNDVSLCKSLKIVKRAPTGFTGMRGKKAEADLNDDDDWSIDPFEQQRNSISDYGNYLNGGYNERFKKAPSAFYGVRGKKYLNELNDLLNKIQEQRVHEMMLQDLFTRLATTEDQEQNEMAKRAPTGFTGLRGKRLLSSSFIDDDKSMEKRAPNNGFVGLRGKKDVDHQPFKRAAAGTAANPLNKKQRFVDFGNKFVAVRGKKSSIETLEAAANSLEKPSATYNYDDNDDIPSVLTHSPMARERLLVSWLPSLLYGSNGKRTPNGFLGMRGKRSIKDLQAAEAADIKSVSSH